jgi:heme/copper-type cytochrome/quinol oxidase subunit 1
MSIKLLFNVKFLTSTVKAMRLFSLAGIITLFLGLYLAFSHATLEFNTHYYSFVFLHILFGLFGFALLLIMGVSFQVFPMFYVAPDFPKFIQNKLPLILFVMPVRTV